MKQEAEFERELQYVAQTLGCRYIKIPDTRMLNQYNRSQNREQKRPFDGILVTPKGNICVECKINYNQLLTHQERFRNEIAQINGKFIVLRKKFYKNSVEYSAETVSQSVQYDNLRDLLKFVMEN
jgi:hypothetical protein